jgi:hypothetical protein
VITPIQPRQNCFKSGAKGSARRSTGESAQQAVLSLSESPHVIDADYIDRFRNAQLAEEAARTAYLNRWREPFN